ncbi:MAG: GGDEF domain-containing protein, partial [Bradymonadaceae bacterium]
DRVLMTLGQLLLNRFRIEDLRARWGGEEFTVVLVNETHGVAQKALQRVLNEFSQIDFYGDGGEVFHVTFSAGIAQFPHDGVDAESLLRTADARLMNAKQSGRNRIIHAPVR